MLLPATIPAFPPNSQQDWAWGAKSLVGAKKRIALQPLKIEGQTGLNVAVGIASVKLTPAK
ncbi:DUF992 domain-containing protein (plasmid) [Sinorhizobium meliloti]|nr:DUF992 domain-containing protein [Sinorhizobium meliloti]